MRRFGTVVFAAVASISLLIADAEAQISLTTLGSPYTQDFNTLAISGTSSTVPSGWAFGESGTNANTTYTAGTGSGATGETYSFGSASSTERAFGGLQSGTLIPTIGASFTNNTGSTITSLAIAYTGEQWRLGATGRTDRLDFQYSTDATSLTTGTWTDANSLDFTSPVTTGTTGALDGNAAANRTVIGATISSLSITNASTFWIRWTDLNATGADDGDAVDDFSLTPTGGSSTNPTGVGAASPTPVNAGSSTLLTVTVTPGANPASTGITVTGDLSSIGGSLTQTLYDDQTHGDVTMNDNIFSFQATVSNGTSAGLKSLPITVADAQSRSSNTSISLTVTTPPPIDSVVISQVYGGGGNTSAPYLNDFIELFNRSRSTIDLTGWSVQYASQTGTTWTKTDLSGTIASGHYYLVQEASGGAVGSALPTPDATGTIPMASTGGKIALLNSGTLLSGACPTGGAIADFVGYGSGANCFEGSAPTAAPGNTTAVLKGSNGCTDADDNASDFTTSAPNPRNTASPSNVCNTPGVSLNPTSLTFSDQRVGVPSSSQPVTLTNSGTAVLNISGIAITSGATDFSENHTCSSTLNPGQSCTINVSFTPAATGARTGTLSITDDATGSPHSVSLSGNGIAPAVALNHTSLDFGNQRVGISSSSRGIMLTNTGTDVLNVASIAVTAGNADFSEIHNCPSTLNPGQNCTIDVTFTPTTTGARNGTLTITDDASDSPQSVPLTGIGTAPTLVLDSASLSFPNQRVGTSSLAHSVKLRNTGTAALNFSSISVTSGASDFSELHTCSASLNPGDSCSVDITFSPSATGLRTGTLTIIDDASGSPHPLSFAGTGISPSVSLDSPSVSFGNQRLNVASAARHVVLTNSGTDVLNIASITAGGDFSQTNNCPGSLNPGQTCTIDLTFTPSALGVRSATLTIIDDASNSPQGLSLSGTGIAPHLLVVDANVDFGSVHIGSNASRNVKLINTGTDVLNFTTIGVTAGNSDYSELHTCNSTLNPGDTCIISATFAPSDLGTRPGTITIVDDASDSPQSVSLTGVGLLACPTITITQTSLPDGNAGAAYNQTITATGGSGGYSYAVTSGTLPGGLSLAPGGALSGTPSVAGSSSFTITVTDDQGCTGSRPFTLHVNPLTISGTVWSDLNANGVHDPGEPPLKGWIIYLDANANDTSDGGELSTISDSSGNYAFANLPGGPYKVREIPQFGWMHTSTNPVDIISTTSGVDFGNHDTLPPVIIDSWTWLDKAYENPTGPFAMQLSATDNSVTDIHTPNSFFEVFFELSTDGGGSWSGDTMTFNSDFDGGMVDGGGRWWSYIDPPPGGYPDGTDIESRIRAVDLSGNVLILPTGNLRVILPRDYTTPVPGRLTVYKRQSDFEKAWYGDPTNSWCGPTAGSSVLQMLGIPGLDTHKVDLVSELAKQMNTGHIPKNGAHGAGDKSGTWVGYEKDSVGTIVANGIVLGFDKYLRNIGQRDNYVIKVYNENSYSNIGYSGNDSYINRAPTYEDFKHQLQDGEGVELIFRYGYVFNNKAADTIGGHCVAGVSFIDGDSTHDNTIIVMDPATGTRVQIPWDGHYGKYSGWPITIKEMVVVSPKGNRKTVAGSASPTGHATLGSIVTPVISVENTHAFEVQESLRVSLQIPALSYSSTKIIPFLSAGATELTSFDDLVLTTKGTFDAVAFTDPGDENPSDDSTHFSFTVVDSQLYRTATMRDWATAVDQKGKLKSIKCKPDKVEFAFYVTQAFASNTHGTLIMIFPIATSGFIARMPDTTTSLLSWSHVKTVTFGVQGATVPLEQFKIVGAGDKGKLITVKYSWRNDGTGRLAGTWSLPTKPKSGEFDYISINRLELPMPNLHNVGEDLQGTSQVAFPITIGLPESTKYVSLAKYADVLKSLVKDNRGVFVLHDSLRAVRCLDSLGGRRVTRRQKNFPPDKGNNKLFAEALALKLNLLASANFKFPIGLGQLIYDDPNDPSNAFNNKSIDTILAQTNQFLSCVDHPKGPAVTGNDFYTVVKRINGAFSGPIDTIRWSCAKLRLTGVRGLADVPWLHGNPNAVPAFTNPDEMPGSSIAPLAFRLEQNYPNPFNPTTTIEFSLAEPSIVTLTVYNVLGQEVVELIHNEFMDEGSQEAELDASKFPSGVYFYHIHAEGVPDEDGVGGEAFNAMRKMVLLK